MPVKFKVRQYRPGFVTGFVNDVAEGLEWGQITTAPWFKSFEHSDFAFFEIAPYGNEYIISAHYGDGKHWVAGFAVPEHWPMASNWRYTPHES